MKALKPCPHCGLKVIHTDEGKHPCAFCGGSLKVYELVPRERPRPDFDPRTDYPERFTDGPI